MTKPNRGYPKRVKIGDNWYRVRVVKKIQGSSTKYAGMFYPNSRLICLLADQSDDELFKSYVHEVIHAFEDEYDIKIAHSGVYKFEEAIFDFFVANYQQKAD